MNDDESRKNMQEYMDAQNEAVNARMQAVTEKTVKLGESLQEDMGTLKPHWSNLILKNFLYLHKEVL